MGLKNDPDATTSAMDMTSLQLSLQQRLDALEQDCASRYERLERLERLMAQMQSHLDDDDDDDDDDNGPDHKPLSIS